MTMRKWENLESLYQRELPREVIHAFVMPLPIVYRSAYDFAYSMCDEPRVGDVSPYIRRAMVEEHLWKTGNRFHKLDAENSLNVARNCHHVEIRSPSIVLTANAVDSPGQMVRDARFRNTLARSNQYVLLPELEEPLDGDYFFAMLLHGPDLEDASRVAFVELAFPSSDPKAKSYLGGSPFNLIAYCEAELYPETKEEEIEDKAAPRLRPRVQVQGD